MNHDAKRTGKYYNCFSFNQMNYLRLKGFKPIDVRMHDGTGNTFWVFELNSALDKALQEWSQGSRPKGELMAV